MTDFQVFQQSPFVSEDLSWNITPPENEFFLPGTLDLSKFTAAQHWPNGFLPSGTILGVVTATGLLGPYLDTAVDGTTTAVGVLRHSIQVVRYVGGTTKTKVGCAYMVHGMVSQAKLPFTVGNAAAGGYIDAAGKVNLPLIYWAA
jgi:hypothetical protein